MKDRSLLGKIVTGGCLWGFLVLFLAVVMEPTPENLTLAVSITLSGGYTLLLYLTRELWINGLLATPLRSAVLLGAMNAAVIETLFLGVERALGASGVAAHPNLLVDLLMTMPWYIGMVFILVRVQNRERFPAAGLLLLGAVYELGADGLVGGLIVPGLSGSPVNPIEYLALMILAAFWQFIPVYSSIVLPPSWVLERGAPLQAPHRPRWIRGLLPLIWLIPFTAYLVVFLIAVGFLAS